jgi:energy-converting hydrogenase B subunit Q
LCFSILSEYYFLEDTDMEHASDAQLGLIVRGPDRPGMLFQVTRVMSDHEANITHVDISDRRDGRAAIYLEAQNVRDAAALTRDLMALPDIDTVEQALPHGRVFGKRVIVIGGGAQVGQVAMGAVSEADRHNIRGERISVDTIPLVGEANIAAAVRAVARLPRARVVVLAGSLMGGDITEAVNEVREQGIITISLNMVGSVPAAADLIVTDPTQAGVMAVMAIADTASFDISRQRGQRY